MKNTSSENQKEFYEKCYDRDTSIYSIPKDDDFIYGQILKQIRPYLSPGLEVLDLGCNNGTLSLYMAKCGCEVTGIDIASNAIESAKNNRDHHKLYNAKFKSIDFISDWNEEAAFDFIICNHVIEHVPQDDIFLKKIFESLKIGGNLLLITPTSYSSLVFMSKLFTGKFEHDEKVGHLRRYNKNQIKYLVEQSGFKINKIQYLDSALRDWLILFKPLNMLKKLSSYPPLGKVINLTDFLLANIYFFPAAISIHAYKDNQTKIYKNK
ncbi:MAG: class I SAM-dependent methyltransferase [Candidatus Methanofastidiosum sp.]|nr:class I SAM-dependent methyltransferase [Methanofastidiosum sp.]